MARLIQQFDVLVSCPSDLQDIVGDVNQTVERFNETYSSYLGIQIKARHWTTHIRNLEADRKACSMKF